MTNNPPTINELRESFKRVYHGPDRLRREYDLVMESEKLGVHIDTYRRLYELRGEEEIDSYPQPKKWWHTPGDWSKWTWNLPTKKKLALGRKGVIKLIQSGVILTIAIGIGRYVWEAPKREKLAHYTAWQMINSAAGQKTSGGRIDALQDLVKDSVSLDGLDASGANLSGIKLQKAELRNTNLSNVYLINANLSNANLYGANLSNANLKDADLSNANLGMLIVVDIDDDTHGFLTTKEVEYITAKQIKKAKNWQSACYNLYSRKKLGLPPENPKNCAGEEKK